MKKTVIAVLGGALLFALPPVAAAKGPAEARVCGPSACEEIEQGRADALIVDRGDRTPRQPATDRYYRVDFSFRTRDGRSENAFSHLFVPSANLMASGGEVEGTVVWFRVTGPALAAIRAAIADVSPFPAPAAWPSS
ncbi:MAG: hypothetical protein M3310_05825, partial [Actinomycetota bacterium]|nr:hypothetical protein [Actinomycetota bacterium]